MRRAGVELLLSLGGCQVEKKYGPKVLYADRRGHENIAPYPTYATSNNLKNQ